MAQRSAIKECAPRRFVYRGDVFCLYLGVELSRDFFLMQRLRKAKKKRGARMRPSFVVKKHHYRSSTKGNTLFSFCE